MLLCGSTSGFKARLGNLSRRAYLFIPTQLEEMRQEIARSLGEPECGTRHEDQDDGQADSARTRGLEKVSV